MSETPSMWSEDDSTVYRSLAPVAVPARAEQIAAMLALMPFAQGDACGVVEIGSGEGGLSYALLECFPQATVTALDGSSSMRELTTRRLSAFGQRARVEPFDLEAPEWHSHLEGADVAVSSLCLHHLDAAGKQRVFRAAAERLSERGALLIADLVAPQRPEAESLFAATWDRAAQAQSQAESGSEELYQRFLAAEWNYYRYPDPFDKPSPLFDQLTWLRQAGFAVVDCFWLRAGHAIYGGYKQRLPRSGFQPVSFESARRSAYAALQVATAAG
jgi:tRNA (cmo5U34)-methyltransferase